MFAVTPFRATLGAAVVALAALGACSDGQEDMAGPPIPTLDAGAVDTGADGTPTGVERVSAGPLNAECSNCVEWSCETGVCGYDTANPPGACCTECDFSQPAEPKPSCEGEPPTPPGSSHCSELPGAMEFGGEFIDNPDGFCREDIEQDSTNAHYDTRCVSPTYSGIPDGGDFYFGTVCPIEFTCCYGGNYGDPIVY